MKLKSFVMSLIVVFSFAFTVPVIAADTDPPQMEQSIQMEHEAAAILQAEIPSEINPQEESRSAALHVENSSVISLQLYADLENEEPGRKRNIAKQAKPVKCEPILHVVPG